MGCRCDDFKPFAIFDSQNFSVCKKCQHKATGDYYAVKIISLVTKRAAALREARLLQKVQGEMEKEKLNRM